MSESSSVATPPQFHASHTIARISSTSRFPANSQYNHLNGFRNVTPSITEAYMDTVPSRLYNGSSGAPLTRSATLPTTLPSAAGTALSSLFQDGTRTLSSSSVALSVHSAIDSENRPNPSLNTATNSCHGPEPSSRVSVLSNASTSFLCNVTNFDQVNSSARSGNYDVGSEQPAFNTLYDVSINSHRNGFISNEDTAVDIVLEASENATLPNPRLNSTDSSGGMATRFRDLFRGNTYYIRSQRQKFLLWKEICIEHQNILTAIHDQDWSVNLLSGSRQGRLKLDPFNINYTVIWKSYRNTN